MPRGKMIRALGGPVACKEKETRLLQRLPAPYDGRVGPDGIEPSTHSL